jgi:PEGA domain
MKPMWSLVARFSCVLGVVAASGCSLFTGKTQNVSVTSDPPGAKVTINGGLVGASPVVYNVKRSEPVSVMVSKEGYDTATRSIEPSISTTGIVDIIGGCVWLFPFFGLLAPGAYTLENPNVSVVLSPKESRR